MAVRRPPGKHENERSGLLAGAYTPGGATTYGAAADAGGERSDSPSLTADQQKTYTNLCKGLVEWWAGLSERAKDIIFAISREVPIISSEIGYGMTVAAAGDEAFTMPFAAAGVDLPSEVRILFKMLAYFFAANDSIISSLPILDPREQRKTIGQLVVAYFGETPATPVATTASASLMPGVATPAIATVSNPERHKGALWAGSTLCLIAYAFGATSPVTGLFKMFGRSSATMGIGIWWSIEQFQLYVLVAGKTPLRFAELAQSLKGSNGKKLLARLFGKDTAWDWVVAVAGSVTRAFVFSYSGRYLFPALIGNSPTDALSETMAWTAFTSALAMNFITIGMYPIIGKLESKLAAEAATERAAAEAKGTAGLLGDAEAPVDMGALVPAAVANAMADGTAAAAGVAETDSAVLPGGSTALVPAGAAAPAALAGAAPAEQQSRLKQLVYAIASIAYFSRGFNMVTFTNTLFNRTSPQDFSFILGAIGLVMGLIAYWAWRSFMGAHSYEAVHGLASRSQCASRPGSGSNVGPVLVAASAGSVNTMTTPGGGATGSFAMLHASGMGATSGLPLGLSVAHEQIGAADVPATGPHAVQKSGLGVPAAVTGGCHLGDGDVKPA